MWVGASEVALVEVEDKEGVEGCPVQAAPAVAYGRTVPGQGCGASGHCDGPCVVRRVRCVISSQVVSECVGEVREEAWVAGGGGGAGVEGCLQC